jgi:hypothetical protein
MATLALQLPLLRQPAAANAKNTTSASTTAAEFYLFLFHFVLKRWEALSKPPPGNQQQRWQKW